MYVENTQESSEKALEEERVRLERIEQDAKRDIARRQADAKLEANAAMEVASRVLALTRVRAHFPASALCVFVLSLLSMCCLSVSVLCSLAGCFFRFFLCCL